MKRLAVAGAVAVAALAGCVIMPGSEWETLIDGEKGLDNFSRFREANWTAQEGAIQATSGGKQPAYLITKQAYKDYELEVEFWASPDANSGVFMRCQDVNNVHDENCYEANIFDTRPDPTYATGAIVKVAKLTEPMQAAGNRWNTFHITAKGSHMVVVMNGKKTAETHDAKFKSGPIALQWGRGTIKWRKVRVREL